MDKTASRAMLEYRLNVRGVWGRNRKAKFESLPLARSEQARPLGEIEPIARAVLAEIRAKPGLRYQIVEQPITVDTYRMDDGREADTTSFMLCTDTKLAEGVVP